MNLKGRGKRPNHVRPLPASFVLADNSGCDADRCPDRVLELDPNVYPADCPRCAGTGYLEADGSSYYIDHLDRFHPCLDRVYQACARCGATGEILEYAHPLPLEEGALSRPCPPRRDPPREARGSRPGRRHSATLRVKEGSMKRLAVIIGLVSAGAVLGLTTVELSTDLVFSEPFSWPIFLTAVSALAVIVSTAPHVEVGDRRGAVR